jgi:hypothetical protein
MQRARMPQLIGLALAGAALYAGYKRLAKELRRAADAAERARAEFRRRAGESAGGPKDLGALEWDEKAGVYRPAGKH